MDSNELGALAVRSNLPKRLLSEAQEILLYDGLSPAELPRMLTQICEDTNEQGGGVAMFDKLLRGQIAVLRAQSSSKPHMLHMRALASVLILIAASAVLLYHLGADPLHSWDEAVYAESAKEMVQDHDWLTPHWNNQPFLQKPPLFIWSTAVMFKLFGVSETAARATSALAGVGCVLLVLFIVRLFASEFTALLAGLILLATGSFNLNSRYAMTDVTLSFFMLLAIYAYLRTKEATWWWLLVGVSSGLGVMTKGAAAIPLFVSLMIVIAWQDRAALRKQHFWLGASLCVIVGGTWHLIIMGLHGKAFVADYFSSQVVSRTFQLMDSPEGQYSAFYYPSIVVLGFFPACLLLPLSIPAWFKAKRLPVILPVFAVTVFALYSLASTKHQWYMIPIFPILSIIAAPLSKKLTPLYLVVIVVGLVFSASNQPSKATLAIADLSQRAGREAGPLGFYPGLKYAPEILFYSNRPLCADAPGHSMGHLAQCSMPEDVIVAVSDIPPGSTDLARSGDFAYCRMSKPSHEVSADILEHSSSTMTLRYSHSTRESRRHGVESLLRSSGSRQNLDNELERRQ